MPPKILIHFPQQHASQLVLISSLCVLQVLCVVVFMLSSDESAVHQPWGVDTRSNLHNELLDKILK